jgi:hypothetical protein
MYGQKRDLEFTARGVWEALAWEDLHKASLVVIIALPLCKVYFLSLDPFNHCCRESSITGSREKVSMTAVHTWDSGPERKR